MKIVAWGDLHGRQSWKLITQLEKDADLFVCMGDEFDTHEQFSAVEQIHNFKELNEFKEKSGKLIMLIGNHTHHYFPEIGYTGTSGYQGGAAKNIEATVNEYRHNLQIAHNEGDILFTHAGVSEVFLEESLGYITNPDTKAEDVSRMLNETFLTRPQTFEFNGFDSSGDDECQTPIWIRPRSLMRASKQLKENKIIQVVGHTSMRKLDIEGKATGGKYFFIDTLGTSGEYLKIIDGVFSSGTIK